MAEKKRELTPEQAANVIENTFAKATFRNEHGDVFTIYSNGEAVLLAGDEINNTVDDKNRVAGKFIPLFNHYFSVWSPDELYKLGKVLRQLHDPKKWAGRKRNENHKP